MKIIFWEVVKYETTLALPLSLFGADLAGPQHSFGWVKDQFLESMPLWGDTYQIRACPLSTSYRHDSIN